MGDTYDAMARFISKTRSEKCRTVGALKRLEALINVNFETVIVNIFIHLYSLEEKMLWYRQKKPVLMDSKQAIYYLVSMNHLI